jgi:nucleoside-triphosphatase THEP1
MMLYLPWRNEASQIEDVNHFEKFEEYKQQISLNRAKFQKLKVTETDPEALERIENEIRTHYELQATENACEIHNANERLMDFENELNESDIDYEFLEDEHGFHTTIQTMEVQTNDKCDSNEKRVSKRPNNSEYQKIMTSLNKRQHRFLMNILYCIKNNETIHLFISGGSGVGKSVLIKAIEHTLNRYLDNELIENDNAKKQKDQQINLIISAFTGKAAFLINGETLHTAFGLTREKKLAALSQQRLKEFQKVYKHLKLIIIDEISLVSLEMFSKIDQRLRQIFDKAKEPFGGISILVLGDFNQKQPVMGQWIFAKINPDNPYTQLQGYKTNLLWDLFNFFELIEIMRQRNDKCFAEALNKFGNEGFLGLTENQIKMFDSRIIKDKKMIPSTVIHVCRTRKEVNQHNNYKIETTNGDLIINTAIHNVIGDAATREMAKKHINFLQNLPVEKAGNTFYEIPLKVNIRYMITVNQNINDGLVNGTCGVLKKIIMNKENTHATKLYFDYGNYENIGLKTRSEKKETKARREIGHEQIEKNWTQMNLSEIEMNISNKKIKIIREQFQIEPAEAVTIHKIQGATLEGVAVDLSQPLSRSDLYVSMSRVTKLDDLYLYGKKSIVQGKDSVFTLDKKTIKRMLKQHYKTDQVQCELRRLRETMAFPDKFVFLKDDETTLNYLNNSFKIICHNIDGEKDNKTNLQTFIGGLRANLPYIKSDYGMMDSDVLIFFQCQIQKPNDENFLNSIHIDGYQLTKVTGYNKSSASNGIAFYTKYSSWNNIKFIADNSDPKSNCYESDLSLQIGLFELNCKNEKVFICYLCVPIREEKKFYKKLFQFLNDNIPCNTAYTPVLYILGTTVITSTTKQPKSKEEQEYRRKLKDIYKVNYLIKPDDKKDYTYTDWCFSNSTTMHEDIMHYESYFVKRKPLWLSFDIKNV